MKIDVDKLSIARGGLPECQLIVQWNSKAKNLDSVSLEYDIHLVGAKPPSNYFKIVINPTIERKEV